MHTLRLSLAGTVILGLLVGVVGSVGVLGQSEDATAQTVHVTGTQIPDSFTSGDTQQVGDVVQVRDGSAVHTLEMSDPRVSGTVTVVFNLDEYLPDEAGFQWGTSRLENGGGAWVGEWSGVFWTPPGAGDSVWDFSTWAVGEGEYEGLTFYYRISGIGPDRDVEGFIFPGDPPPLP
jgi:hypothetical protein